MSLWILRMIEEQFHRDTDDRPLRESRTPAAHLRPGDIQHRTCPYAGSRLRHPCPMNVSALRQTSAHWGDLLDALAFLRVLDAPRRGPRPPDLMALWRLSQLGSSLPWFYVLRGDGTERAPAYTAALAKATQGVGLWAQRLLADLLTGTPPPPTFTAATLLASAEASGTLIGETEVCAGSESMLRRFFDVLLDGEPALTSAPLQRLAGERDRVLTFGGHYTNFKLALWIHALARQFVYADLLRALGPAHIHAAELRALIAAGGEPPDFILVLPPDPAAVPVPLRATWLHGLAQQVVAMAPDRSDHALHGLAVAIAHAGDDDDDDASALAAALTGELAARTGLADAALATAARAIATLVRLDELLAAVAATVEAGFRSADPSAVAAAPITAADRDRLLIRAPRPLMRQLAPVTLAARGH